MEKNASARKLGGLIHAGLALVACGLLAWVLSKNADAIHKVYDRPLNWNLFAIAGLIYMIGVVSTFVRWYFLVKVVDPRFTLRAAILLGFIGNLFNLLIPGAVGGDLIKAAYLSRMHVKRTQAIASMVIDRILGLLGLFLLASVAGAFIWSAASPEIHKLIVVAWVINLATLLLLVAIFSQVFTRIFPGLGRGHGKVSLIVDELKEMSSTYRRRLDVVGLGWLMAAGNHTLNVLAFFLVGKMLFPSMPTTLTQHFLLAPLTLFTIAVPLPFGALGLSESVADVLGKMVNHPSGMLAMLGVRVLMYGGALVGLVVYLTRIREVRALAEAARHSETE